jgi:hypothetical protein
MGRPSTSRGGSPLRISGVAREDYCPHCRHHQIDFYRSVSYRWRYWQSDLIWGPVKHTLYSGHSSCSFFQGDFEGLGFDRLLAPSDLYPPSASRCRSPFNHSTFSARKATQHGGSCCFLIFNYHLFGILLFREALKNHPASRDLSIFATIQLLHWD